MKKKLIALILAVTCMLTLTGCFCEHEWAEATCTAPRTCTKCSDTEGEALGHVWLAATCEAPKTCEVCSVTEGEAKGHAWVDASCEEPKHCETCGAEEGSALGHYWLDATTESPKRCTICAKTEGEKIVTDPRFNTPAVKDLLGKWACYLELDGSALGVAGLEDQAIPFTYFVEFGHAGELKFFMELTEGEVFMETLIEASIENAYAQLEAQGISREQAQQNFQDTYGMSIEEYMDQVMGGIDMNAILESVMQGMDVGGVYYVADGKLWSGLTWEGKMEESDYTLQDDVLIIQSISDELGFEAEFYRVR